MTLINPEPDDFVPLTKAEALALTAKIKAFVGQAWRMIAIAYQRRAHVSLGYPSWEAYMGAEFGIGRSHSYRLLDRAFVIGEIEQAAGLVDEVPGDIAPLGMSPMGDIVSEREARDLKPHIALVRERVREAVADVQPEQVAKIVTATVRKVREEVVRQREADDAIRDLNERFAPEGWDEAAQARDAAGMEERGALTRVMTHIAGMRAAAEFVADQPDYVTPDQFAVAVAARDWLSDFIVAKEQRWPTSP